MILRVYLRLSVGNSNGFSLIKNGLKIVQAQEINVYH